ncbi:MAG: MFS transporter [Calditrichaeota bacterium]|nr:MFS transporter [Calditrichota bacterium]RQW00745.1 MAG: MFS transporter [Calditrichota bacterium]
MKNNRLPKISWALYDWANSAFATTVMAGFFPIFFKSYWANPDDPVQSTFYLGLANSVASIIIAALAPILGAIADKGSVRKKLLMAFAFFGIILTGSLRILEQGLWEWAILFYVSATVGWTGANIFYDSLLPTVSVRKDVDIVSSLGYSLGYAGGGLLFLLNVFMFINYEWFGFATSAGAIKASFLMVAVWWAVFTIPLILFVKEPKTREKIGFLRAVKAGWKQLRLTLADLKHFKIVAMFLLAYWLYIDGVDTIVRMAVDYGKSLNFSDFTLITALLMVQFIAFPAALAYGWLAGRIGPKKAVLYGIVGYIFITFFGYFMQQEWHFYFLAAMVGLFQGGIQAISRSLYSRIIPHNKAAEFFGFYNMLGKFAAVIGPVLMGSVTVITGSSRVGILSILVLFISGGLLLWRVDIQKGEEYADKYLSEKIQNTSQAGRP